MRFYCGPTLAERMIVRARLKRLGLEQWHPFFCLLPRRIGQQCVWMEWIRRKGRYVSSDYGSDYWAFEYRLSAWQEMHDGTRSQP